MLFRCHTLHSSVFYLALLLYTLAFLLSNFFVITGTDITVWTVSALLAIGIGSSRYAKWKTRNKLVRELASMDAERREKMLNRLNPKLAMEVRQDLMTRFRIMT